MQKAVENIYKIVNHLYFIKKHVVLSVIFYTRLDMRKNLVRITKLNIGSIIKSDLYNVVFVNPILVKERME